MQHPPAGLPRDSGAFPSSEHEGPADEAERALADRPYISISLRIGLSMLLCFLLIASVVGVSLKLISTVSISQEFLEKVSMYALEVEHARRFEKNYLLYGTNLDDALTQIQAAHQLLRSMKESMIELVGLGAFEAIERSLEQYGSTIERLAALDRKGNKTRGEERSDVERELRRNGAQMLADANNMMDRERLRLHTAIRTSSWIAASSLLFIPVVMVFVTFILTRQIANPLRRFVEYTERIAGGDFSPIQPARRYRDEFSHLAIAINRMSSQLKDREAQLARTSRMAAVGTLTAGIAHELNNPLTNIGLNAEALHDGLTSYTEAQKLKMLNDIVTQVERASATVRNLLDFTRVEKPVFVSLSLADVVRGVRNLLSNEAELSNVLFDIDVPEGLPRVQGSPRDLQQVFLNLFLNAIQAMPDGGTLSVHATATDEGTIQIELADTGVGIPEEQLGSIYDPFFTTKEVGQGTGLGLFVTYGIVERHKGSIAVKSEVGAGTTFTVTLPISPQAAKERVGDRQEH
jgi:two-component system NtrC family sensor kinase